jgi:hypothetical protein
VIRDGRDRQLGKPTALFARLRREPPATTARGTEGALFLFVLFHNCRCGIAVPGSSAHWLAAELWSRSSLR